MSEDKFKKMYYKLYNKKESFIDLMEDIINKLDVKNQKYVHNKKYTTKDYIIGIIEVLSNNVSWRKYNGYINGRILNNKHNYYVKIGVYDELYKTNLDKYLKNKKKPLKVLSVDSTFISNKNGNEKLGRNIYYKNKRGRKVTTIVEEKCVPLNVHVTSGNKHDARIAPKIINRLENNTTNKCYILADKAYDSRKIRELIKSKNYKPIIARRRYTNRKVRSLKKKYIKLYRKRIIVENLFSWLKAFPKLDKIYEKTVRSYNGLLLLGISIIIYRKIQ
jgi:transposase